MLQRVKWLPIIAVLIGTAAVVAGMFGADAAATIPGGLLSVVIAILAGSSGE